jgi:hypothetical protein
MRSSSTTHDRTKIYAQLDLPSDWFGLGNVLVSTNRMRRYVAISKRSVLCIEEITTFLYMTLNSS